MSKYNTLTKNTLFLLLSQFSTKIIGFFLVPLYTRVLTTEEYGIYDLSFTTINLLIPILTLNIGESVLRFVLENTADSRKVLTVSFKYMFFGSAVMFSLLAVNGLLGVFQILNPYWIYVWILFFLSIFNTNISYYAKGIGKLKESAVCGVVGSIVTLSLNVLLLVVVKKRLDGYYVANILGMALQSVALFFLCSCHKGYIKSNLKPLEKEMRLYSLPLIGNSLAWWVNSSADKYIITAICGVSANGIYSVAYKIPSILNIVQNVFNQAWSISSVTEFESSDEDNFFSNIYKMLNCVLTIVCSIIIVSTKIIAKILYSNEFYVAWKYVPFLTISIVFGSLSGFFGGVFCAVKDTKILAKTTVLGAILNILLNVFAVKIIGSLGASITTAFSYFVVWFIRFLYIKKYMSLKTQIRKDILSYLILTGQSVIMMIFDSYYLYIIEMVLFVVLLMLNKNIIAGFFKLLKEKGKHENRNNDLV